MAKENPKLESIKMRQVKPKKTLGLSIRPALQLPLPHDALIKSSDEVNTSNHTSNDLKFQSIDIKNYSVEQTPTNTYLDQHDQLTNTPVQNLDPSNLDRSKIYTGLEINLNQENSAQEIKAGYLKLPNEILDNVLPKLSPTETVIFLRLYRLSVGFNSNLCTVGITSLIKACNISEQTCRTSLRRLVDLKLIKQIEVINTKEIKGTTYQILAPLEIRPVQNLDRSNNNTSIIIRPNKYIDDDLKNHDHHQSKHEKAVMMIYQKITNNSWTKADIESYQKIKNIPLESIEMAIKLATQRAATHPNSLAYFVKEIINIANPPKQNRSLRKKVMEKIVERVRNSFVGSSYSMSDFVHKVKDLCLKEDVNFDNDIFDEIVAKKNRY